MYRAIDAGMVRASVFPLAATLPPWPNLYGDASADVHPLREWIAQVWTDDTVAAAIEFATPSLPSPLGRC